MTIPFSPPSLRYTFHSTGRISHPANIHSKQRLPLKTGVERCMERHHPSLLQLRLRYSTLASSLCVIARLSELFSYFASSSSSSLLPSLFFSVSVSHGGTEKALMQNASSIQRNGDNCPPSGWVCTLELATPPSGKKLSHKAVPQLSSISVASGNDIVTLSLKLLFKVCFCFTGNLKKRTRKVLGTL